jgi:hypothetical protein
MASEQAWAEAEFGDVNLGDSRRTRRLVALAAEVARQPAGSVTKVCSSSASREGAFRWLENPAIRRAPVAQGIIRSTLSKCAAHRLAYVALDSASIAVTDRKRTKGTGGIGAWSLKQRGVLALSALAMGPEGEPLGICGQNMWVREQRSRVSATKNRGQTETRFWLDLLCSMDADFRGSAPDCTPWYQLDRGGDCWPVLALAQRFGLLLTVRAAHDRRLEGEEVSSLWQAVENSSLLGYHRVHVRARKQGTRVRKKLGKRKLSIYRAPRPARIAKVAIRAVQVPLRLKTGANRNDTLIVPFGAVLVTEVGAKPDDRIEWLLLTTHPVRSFKDALAVVRGYTFRWRIEELHRMWKRGLCRVEETQLRSREAIFKWATILGAVASRALRLTHLARSEPDIPASAEMTRAELDALIAMRQPKGISLGHVPTLGQAVRWIADLGGYTGPWNGPPGPTIIGRGLRNVLITARALENMRQMR